LGKRNHPELTLRVTGNSSNLSRCSNRSISRNCSTLSWCSSRWVLSGAPMEIRTPVLALKGPRPSPLDNGGLPCTLRRAAERTDFTIPAQVGQAISWDSFSPRAMSVNPPACVRTRWPDSRCATVLFAGTLLFCQSKAYGWVGSYTAKLSNWISIPPSNLLDLATRPASPPTKLWL
jgi:hypothetical protein